MTHTIDSLNQMSLREIRKLFSTLEPPPVGALVGIFQGFFVGPGILRRIWGPLLALTGLGGWWGKAFDSPGKAVNLTLQHGRFDRRFPMAAVEQISYLDRQPGLALRYQPDTPFPWPFIVDEMRQIEAGRLLGMTLMDIRPFRQAAFPFVLEKQDAGDAG